MLWTAVGGENIPSQRVCVGSVALVFALLCFHCARVIQPLFSGAARPKSSAGRVGIATDPPLIPSPPPHLVRRRSLEPGALMFQHADVGKSPAGPVVVVVVVPVSLALALQSPSAAPRRRHAAAGAGADRAAVLEHADLQLRAALRGQS